MMSTLLKLGLRGCDVKPRFVHYNVNISYKIHFFFEEKKLMALDTYVKKNEPTLDCFLGGVHGKSCLLTAYISMKFIYLWDVSKTITRENIILQRWVCICEFSCLNLKFD